MISILGFVGIVALVLGLISRYAPERVREFYEFDDRYSGCLFRIAAGAFGILALFTVAGVILIFMFAGPSG